MTCGIARADALRLRSLPVPTIPASVAWLTEEVGELAQSLRKGDPDQQSHEFADVLAWTFSLANQAVQLGYLPRVQVVHTSSKAEGQIYIPEVNWLLMVALGVSSNIMSLGGIAIAIGAMVDAAIIMVENAHTRLEEWEREGKPIDRTELLIRAAPPAEYVVRAGDTLSGIARRFGVGTSDLARLNGLDLDSVIRPGDRVRIPRVGS